MKQILLNVLFITLGLIVSSAELFAQTKFPELSVSSDADQTLARIRSNISVNADSTFKILNNWADYPGIKETGKEYLFYYTDPELGKIPMRVYIPPAYTHNTKTGCVLMLHGAVGISHIKDIDSLYKFDSDALFNNLKTQNYIVVRPVGDRDKKFDWVVNRYSGRNGSAPNLTFNKLAGIFVALKKVLNIDDNKVFAFGHSDGSDGAVGMGVFVPDQFAGIIAYNSMLDNIFAKDFYIRNIQNRPLYLVHSDLDDLRPIQQARIIIDSLRQTDKDILYKEYIGYKHEDKHLDKDVPLACLFMKGISRNPFGTSVYWETLRYDIYNGCDWLKITDVDTDVAPAPWHHLLITKAYNKIDKTWEKNGYQQYGFIKKSSAAKALFHNNTFTIQTSGVKEIELLISPVMINMENPVIININGRQVFTGKVIADKQFMLKNFSKTYDRQAIWVNSVKVKVE